MFDKLRSKNFHTWLRGYAIHRTRRALSKRANGLRHIMLAMCDHYEPLWGQPDESVGEKRVQFWQDTYPKLAASFRDSDGIPPQHTFFFPGEEYRPAFFDRLEPLIRNGFGEIEVHLHHDNATETSLRSDLLSYITTYANRGHLARDKNGLIRYGFIHGNWALANGRPDGRMCGVDNELSVLFETGCYADFTFPSAPDITQPNIVNSIYWPDGDLSRKRAYEWGEEAEVGHRYHDRILMVQGPIAISKREGSLKLRIDTGAVTAKDPATATRIQTWLDQHIHIQHRPEWVFIKAYTHGAPEKQAASLLGADGYNMHRALAAGFNDGIVHALHYVTAREMVNIMLAAMDGETGNPNKYRDYVLPKPPMRQK